METTNVISKKEQIDELIEKLKMRHEMTLSARREIFLLIKSVKLQWYFQSTYPESMFKDGKLKKVDIKALLGFKSESDQPPMVDNNLHKSYTIPLPSETKGAKRYIYGTYIEMAFHNFFLNMQYIYKVVFGIDIMYEAKQNHESDYQDSWDGDFGKEKYVWIPIFKKCRESKPEERQKIEEMIVRLFPMMIAAKDIGMDSIDVLERLSQSIRILRNYYSHYRTILSDYQINTYNNNVKFIIKLLDKAYYGSKNIVRTRFSYDDKDMHCAEQYEYIRKEKKENPHFKYKLVGADKHLSVFGLVFLTSLFLEKKYSKIFTDKLKYIPKEDQRVMNELIAVYRIRLHTEKLTICKATDALAFDILTELRKCPKELFEHLSPEDQCTFRVKAADEENGIDEALMVRHSDRFPHLMMKYIDDSHLFDKIRFQVSLGKYFFKFYNKYCIDNNTEARVRALSKTVNGFGRISEMEEKRTEKWEKLIRKHEDFHINTTSEAPYITDHHANYIVTGNRIAMRFCNDGHTFPEIDATGARNPAPSCWMSTYELPAMMFLMHLTGSKKVEDIILKTVETYSKFFTDVTQGKIEPVNNENELSQLLEKDYPGLTTKNIPEEIANYLSGNCQHGRIQFKDWALLHIDTLIEETKNLQDKFRRQKEQIADRKNNKLGKKSYVTLQPGKLASFLAKDIMLFQPNDAENKNKLTSLNFRILQSILAQYNKENEELLKRTLTSARIINADDESLSNPIIKQLLKSGTMPDDTIELYRRYLEERLNYLKSCKSRNLSTLSFLYANRTRWQEHDAEFYRAKAGRYLHENYMGTDYDKAVELPRGLFDKYIREKLMEIANIKDLAADKGKNISYLIYAYVKNVLKDECQPMYDLRRTYPLLKKLDKQEYCTPQELSILLMQKKKDSFVSSIKMYCEKNRGNKKSCTEEGLKSMLAHLKDNETDIKRFKVQDMIMFMAAKRMLVPDTGNEERNKAFNNIRLCKMQDENTLSQKIKFVIDIMSKNGYGKKIYQNDLKLKDYPKFYRFLLDRRIPSLLDLVRSNYIDRKLIDDELDGYDKVHPEILEKVMKFEKDHDNDPENSTHFTDMLKSEYLLDYNDKETLQLIRNAFAHCTYPPYRYIGENAKSKDLPEKAKEIANTFSEKIN